MAQVVVTSEDPTAADRRTERAIWPGVSVVLPVLNEERHLAAAVAGVLDQQYPGPLEIILALGPSTDRTSRVAERLTRSDPRIRTVPNPCGSTPAALNAAIRAARHPVVARLDGHAIFGTDYLRTAVDLLDGTGADVVGGGMLAGGRSVTQQAFGAAMSSPFGVGHAVFRTGGDPGPADSVYLGVFRRAALTRHGGFDESCLHAQDWELNHRIRAAGGVVWFSPELSCHYQPRMTLAGLARQYLNYGRWRRALIRRYPDTINLRYLAPPVGVVGMTIGLALAATGRRVGWLAPVTYAGWLAIGTVRAAPSLSGRARCLVPIAIATMHWSWAWGFLSSPRRLAAAPSAPAVPIRTGQARIPRQRVDEPAGNPIGVSAGSIP